MRVSREQAFQCCACGQFADALSAREFHDAPELIGHARGLWWREVGVPGWLEAFAAHPRIGDVEGLRRKYGGFADMSRGEQAAAAGASEAVLQELAEWNARYEARFGHIFIVCAAGKSAAAMLAAVKDRCGNDPYRELSLAAAEQMRITELRLLSLLYSAPPAAAPAAAAAVVERRAGQMRAHLDGKPLTSPVTSHVLDTCRGCPAEGVRVTLEREAPGSAGVWEPLGSALTNSDGRVPDLLPPSPTIEPGTYRVGFGTRAYAAACGAAHPGFFAPEPFYPTVHVQFVVTQAQTRQHFHIPLTWNPYSYSTYRGS